MMEKERTKGLISVIIPCYNVEKYIGRCIDSILNNTYRDLEVICINDGSSDSTLDILKKYEDSRVVVLSHENMGMSKTRNRGIDIASGEFICFIDSDDWIHKEYFERLISAQSEVGADVTYCKYRIVHDFCDDQTIDKVSVVKKRFFSAFDNPMLKDVVWCKLYKAGVIGNNRFKTIFSEDKLFNAQLLLTNKDAVSAFVDVEMYYYYMRSDSAIHTYHEDRLLPLAMEFYELSKCTDDLEIRKEYTESCLKIALSTRYMTMFRPALSEYNNSCTKFLNSVGVLRNTSLSLAEKVRYFAFIKLPGLYRYFRKKMDPTMSNWEKRELELQKKN